MTSTLTDTPVDDGLVYLSPPTAYRMADEWYGLACAEHFWFRWRLAALRALLRGDPPAGPFLEVGCGHGVARAQLEEAFDCPIHGCDVNAAALRRAPRGRGRLYFYDVHQRRPEWARHFGTIFLLDTLEHIEQPVAFLRSVAFHLQTGGRLVLNVPAFQWLFGAYDRAAGHVKRYTAGVLRQELAAAGLRLTRWGYWGLTLLPFAVLRKWLLAGTPPEQTIQRGFEPPSRLADACLRALMRLECALRPLHRAGTSLAAVARKDTQ